MTGPLEWVEEGGGEPRRVLADPAALGDVVLARKEVPASYHLAVTVDDAIQGVTLVTRGEDLAPATHIHRLLQALLGLPTPRYRHHQLLTDANRPPSRQARSGDDDPGDARGRHDPGGTSRPRPRPRNLNLCPVGAAPGAGGPP